jgi:serine/threonine protein kinase
MVVIQNIFREVVMGVAHMHSKGISHGDIKGKVCHSKTKYSITP